ncbi:MAG: AI-2E family transporter [Bacteroidales bacterium]|nr:AI-2E family transporter [Bacteroidales bacterium]
MSTKTGVRLNVRNVSLILGFGVIGFLAWYFSEITIYLILSMILALISSPLKKLVSKIKVRGYGFSNTIATVLALCGVVCIMGVLLYLVIPPVAQQINSISAIDEVQFTRAIDQPLQNMDVLLKNYNIINEDEHVKDIIINTTTDYVKKINLSSLFGGVLQGLGSLFLAVFSILFIAFFMLLDFTKVQNTIVRMAPNQFQHEITNIFLNSKRLLSNYFVGLFLEIIIMSVLEFLILSLFGVPNALLISVISGLMIIIPYIGSIISFVLGVFIAMTSVYLMMPDANLTHVLLKVMGTSIICRLLDNFFLQPFIASKSVKAHPLEIFLIVLLAGMIAGVPGMMLGIPAYTFVRVFAKEFFGNNNFIRTLTEKMDIKKE